ncbi:MAG TPA: AAA family ATPase, partial [Verrucomicrobiales bacterium]|nr:AAA family ATPase [Verrucomicrobiales bacterium]
MDSLFTPDDSASNEMESHSGEPLAARMRPHSLSEIAGQKHILAEGKLLRRAIEADRFTSLIFYGPPGTGKTTLASVIARTTGSRFESLNGVESNVAEIRAKIESARTYQTLRDQTTVLFIDEIHRFNKAQQDSLLPHLERGTVRFIGATTHNPYFYVNSPLVSRSQIFQLEPVATDDLVPLLERALN